MVLYLTSISMKAKPGGFRATQTSRTRPILEKASSRSNLIDTIVMICLVIYKVKWNLRTQLKSPIFHFLSDFFRPK